MCKVTQYINSAEFGYLYDLVCSQRKYYDRDSYWKEAAEIHWKQFPNERFASVSHNYKNLIASSETACL